METIVQRNSEFLKFAQNIAYHPDHCTIFSTSFKHSENLSQAYHTCDNKKES